MNVLYIVGGEGNRYGSEIIAIDLLTAGEAHGIHYTVITANKGAVSEACDQMGIDHHVVPFTFFVYKAMGNGLLNFIKKTVWRARAELLTRRAAGIIEKTVDMRSIDVIHTNLTRDLLGGVLAEKYGIPHVWHIQELFKAHYQLSFLRNGQAAWMADHADRFLAISRTVADEWVENGLPGNKVSVVYNGIDCRNIKQKEAFDDEGDLKLAMVGHIVPAKGQESVIRRLSRLPAEIRRRIAFDCIGEGTAEYKKALVDLAEKLDVRVGMRGYCADVGGILRDYDVGINCSRGEGFGLSTAEYMAAGLCPVVADTGANTELIRDGENGFVFDYAGEDSLAELIGRLYADRDEMRRAARRAAEDARSRFTLEKMQQEVFAWYKDLAKKRDDRAEGILQ